MPDPKDYTNRFLSKVVSVEFLALLVLGTASLTGTYFALASGQDANQKNIASNTKQIQQIADDQKREFETVKNELNQVQVQNAIMKNEQDNQGKNIERILKILERDE